jgi:uncharacterized DUF497 family protein
MAVAADGFDRDEGNRHKCQKHGLSIAEIEAFIQGDPRVAPALKHSSREERLVAVGATDRDVLSLWSSRFECETGSVSSGR